MIRAYVKYAPAELDLRIVGGGEPGDDLGAWRTAELEGRHVRFMPVFRLARHHVKPLVPDTLRYAMGLLGRKLESDFMHFHAVEPTIGVRRWRGEKTLFVHVDIEAQLTTEPDRNESYWARFPSAYLALERTLIRQFDHVLSCNRASLNFHRRRYPDIESRFKLVRNCVDSDVFYPFDHERRAHRRRELAIDFALHGDTRFVLFAGRLERMKDPLLLLRAFAALDHPTTHLHLLMAGDGSMRAELRRALAELRIASKVTLLGAVAPRQLADLQRVSSVLAVTSSYEGLSLAALEALACGTPVVSTPAGDIASVVTPSAGIVTSGFTARVVTLALRTVLQNPQKYPASSCLEAARPYLAHNVVPDLCREMLGRRRAIDGA